MRLLGQKRVMQVYEKLVDLTSKNKSRRYIALPADELCKIIGITERIFRQIESVLEMLGYIRRYSRGGSGTTVIEVVNPKRKPTPGEIEVASVVYAIYSNAFHKLKFSSYSISPNIVRLLFNIYNNNNESMKQILIDHYKPTNFSKIVSNISTNAIHFYDYQKVSTIRRIAIVDDLDTPLAKDKTSNTSTNETDSDNNVSMPQTNNVQIMSSNESNSLTVHTSQAEGEGRDTDVSSSKSSVTLKPSVTLRPLVTIVENSLTGEKKITFCIDSSAKVYLWSKIFKYELSNTTPTKNMENTSSDSHAQFGYEQSVNIYNQDRHTPPVDASMPLLDKDIASMSFNKKSFLYEGTAGTNNTYIVNQYVSNDLDTMQNISSISYDNRKLVNSYDNGLAPQGDNANASYVKLVSDKSCSKSLVQNNIVSPKAKTPEELYPFIRHYGKDIYIGSMDDDKFIIERYKISNLGVEYYEKYRPVERFFELFGRTDIEAKRKERYKSHMNLDRDLDNYLMTYEGLLEVLYEFKEFQWARIKPTIEIHYDCLVGIYTFINRYLDVEKFINDLEEYERTGIIPAYKSYKKKERPQLFTHVLYRGESYGFYSLLRRKSYTFSNFKLPRETLKKLAGILFKEVKDSSWYRLNCSIYGEEYTKGKTWAAIAGVVFGYMPIGIGISQVYLYLKGLKDILNDELVWITLASKLNNHLTRYATMNDIFAAMAHMWEHVSDRNSKLYTIISNEVSNYIVRDFTRSEQRVIRTVEHMLMKDKRFHAKVQQLFGITRFKLSTLLERRDTQVLTDPLVTYNGFLAQLLTRELDINFSLIDHIMQPIECSPDLPINLSLDELSYFSFQQNIYEAFHSFGYKLNRLKYEEHWLNYQAEYTIPALFGAPEMDGSDKRPKPKYLWLFKSLFKDKGYNDESLEEAQKAMALILYHTQYRIWLPTLVDMITTLSRSELKLFNNLLRDVLGEFPKSYRKYHGIKIVNTIWQVVRGTLNEPQGTVAKRVYSILQRHDRTIKHIDFDLQKLPWEENEPDFDNFTYGGGVNDD